MGWRKTGKKKTVTEEISECYCDVCGKTIPEATYPELELIITWKEYHYESDAPEHLDICSSECLITKANGIKK